MREALTVQSAIGNPTAKLMAGRESALPYYFCTYFDYHYLSRGLVLYKSLKQHWPSSLLWVLCMDPTCYDILSQMALPDLRLIALEDFERDDQELLRAKQNRTLVEYYFTCTPSLPLFILNEYPEVDLITYLDADLFFFADPAPVFEEIANSSIAIIEHRFAPNLRDKERNGIYNVGWLSFRRDINGLACLRWWRERCIEWCYDRPDGGRYADQKYLDDWPTRFEGVVVVQHKGANVAPWNVDNYRIHKRGENVWVDAHPLIFFHFQGFKQVGPNVYDPNLESYHVAPSGVLFQAVYAPYIRELLRAVRQSSSLPGKPTLFEGVRYLNANPKLPKHRHVMNLVKSIKRLLNVTTGVLQGKYMLVINGHVLWWA